MNTEITINDMQLLRAISGCVADKSVSSNHEGVIMPCRVDK